MILREQNDILNESYKVCLIHIERMQYAYGKIHHLFPLNIDSFSKTDADILSYFDQFVYRFSKLQDFIGAKLFKSILDNLGEETRGLPFIDLLNKLESLNIIDDSEDWFLLREIRNMISHEYPFKKEEIVEGLNLLSANYELLLKIWTKIENFILERFSFLIK